ncbi:hypothetical protein [Burkholderia ubonensis]|uniref:hypothetical protein n=1 Tax=Burkholderia ubonensis TaxID=101571 RepID=UPI0012FC93C3|nr:hypothetical protein [Burkholderia ubonensis]
MQSRISSVQRLVKVADFFSRILVVIFLAPQALAHPIHSWRILFNLDDYIGDKNDHRQPKDDGIEFRKYRTESEDEANIAKDEVNSGSDCIATDNNFRYSISYIVGPAKS